MGLQLECAHHWRIEMPRGPVCKSWCELCGKKGKEYLTTKYGDYNSRPTKRTPAEDQQEMIYE